MPDDSHFCQECFRFDRVVWEEKRSEVSKTVWRTEGLGREMLPMPEIAAPFSVPFSRAPGRMRRTQFWVSSFAVFWARVGRQPPHANPCLRRPINTTNLAWHLPIWIASIPWTRPVWQCPLEMSRFSRGHSVQSVWLCTDIRSGTSWMSLGLSQNRPRNTSKTYRPPNSFTLVSG